MGQLADRVVGRLPYRTIALDGQRRCREGHDTPTRQRLASRRTTDNGCVRRRTTRRRASAASTEINTTNVRNLRVDRRRSRPAFVRGHEAAPIVANNTMYIVTPFPNIVYALDLTKPGLPVEVAVQSEAGSGIAGRRVLRRRQSRRRVRRRKDLLQHARRSHHRARRRDRQAGLEHEGRRHSDSARRSRWRRSS